MHRLAWLLLIGISVAAAGAEPPPWLLQSPAAGAWQQDSTGTWQGRGHDFGQSWREDSAGDWQGRPGVATTQIPSQPRTSPARLPPSADGASSP